MARSEIGKVKEHILDCDRLFGLLKFFELTALKVK